VPAWLAQAAAEIFDNFSTSTWVRRRAGLLLQVDQFSAGCRSNGVSLVTIRHSGAANSVGSLSPRAASRHKRERSISVFTRVFDALWERVGVRGAFVGYRRARCTPSPRRHSASKARVNALMAATLSRNGRGYDPAARVELIEPSCHRHELASGRR
jgi:hypothetical protein